MKKIISIIIIIILVVGAVALVKKRKAQSANAKTANILPVVVETKKIKKDNVSFTLPAIGIVGSNFSTILSTKITGKIKKIYKQEGDRINKGDIIAEIDASDIKAKKEGSAIKKRGIIYKINAVQEKIKALKIKLKVTKEAHERTKELFKVDGASVEQLGNEKAQIADLEAQISSNENLISELKKEQQSLNQSIKGIESLIKYSKIKSPIDGTLSKRLVDVGDMAMPGKPLFGISSKEGLYINVSLPDDIKTNKIIFKGKKLSLVPKNQANDRGLNQYIAYVPDELNVVEGQYVNIRVVTYEGKVCLIPIDGILNVDKKAFVFIVQGKKAIPLEVNIMHNGSEGVSVDKDLNGKTIVIAKPDILLRISSGVPIHILQKSAKDASNNISKQIQG